MDCSQPTMCPCMHTCMHVPTERALTSPTVEAADAGPGDPGAHQGSDAARHVHHTAASVVKGAGLRACRGTCRTKVTGVVTGAAPWLHAVTSMCSAVQCMQRAHALQRAGIISWNYNKSTESACLHG